MILIISHPKDVHALCVSKELNNLGIKSSIVYMDTFANHFTITHGIGKYSNIKNCHNDMFINGSDIETIWFRRPMNIQQPEVFNLEDRKFIEREWLSSFMGFLMSLKSRFINSPIAQQAAVKPRQLEAALKVGLRIPNTCITNDPIVAKDFVESHKGKIVHKALTSPINKFLATKRWTDSDYIYLKDLSLAPTIFQEEINGSADIRLTVVGNDIYASKISMSNDILDSRLVEYSKYSSYNLDDRNKRLIHKLMEELGLVFGTIDLKLVDDEEYVFFEINPQGQFLYVEILTGLPITYNVAKFLANMK